MTAGNQNMVKPLSGVYPAIFTPYDQQNKLNLDMLSRIADFQLKSGVHGFFACGSTGEGLLLSEDERTEVVRHLASEFGSRATIIAHVGHPSTDIAVRLARRAADAGADWIASVGPIYFGTTFEGAMRHYRQIAAATDLPFMIYSIHSAIEPGRDAAFFQLPNVCGMKYTGPHYFSVQQLVGLLESDVFMVSGMDEHFVAALSFGFCGGIGSTYNFAPRHYVDIFECYQRGEIHRAAEFQRQINRVTALMIRHENWSYAKAIMRYIGFDCGPARAPFEALSEPQYQSLCAALDELNIIERQD